MILAQAIARFLERSGLIDSTVNPEPRALVHQRSLSLLSEYFPTDATLHDVTPSILRDLVSRWYIERASASSQNAFISLESRAVSNESRTTDTLNTHHSDHIPEPRDLLSSLEEFFIWADQQAGPGQYAELSSILIEMGQTLPRAMEITDALTTALRERGGAFTFPEFLTSFEQGGSSQYDIDAPGNAGAIDGYLRIIRVEGTFVEAEELISEERVWPIIFPREAAALVKAGYILSLELIRDAQGWQIAACGFAYPPGTQI
jgi:hypothetical protein